MFFVCDVGWRGRGRGGIGPPGVATRGECSSSPEGRMSLISLTHIETRRGEEERRGVEDGYRK